MVNEQLLDPYIKENILSLDSLKEGNLPLYKYVYDNLEHVKDSLQCEILDESKPIRGYSIIRKYLRFHYGEVVNVSKVRADKAIIYNSICALGNPEDVINEMGFIVEYNRKFTMSELKNELDAIVVNGLVGKLTKRLDNKLRYESNKRGITINQYLKTLGYTSSYGGEEFIDKSRKGHW